MKTNRYPLVPGCEPLNHRAARPALNHCVAPGNGLAESVIMALPAANWEQMGQRLGLSCQESRVVQCLLAGHKLAAVAQELHLGLGTVKTYCQRVYRKLHVSNQCTLAVAVISRCVHSSNADSAPVKMAIPPRRAEFAGCHPDG